MDKFTKYALANNTTRDKAIEILCSECDAEECSCEKKDNKKTKEHKGAYSTK